MHFQKLTLDVIHNLNTTRNVRLYFKLRNSTEMSTAEDNSTEDILKRHKQERKELQAKIQSLKKTAPKGKKKKEVADQIAQLEKELDDKHQQELSCLQPATIEVNVEESVEQEENEDVAEENVAAPTRVTRAQRRRNKKENEEKQRDKRIQEQEEHNKTGPRVKEINTIKELLQGEGLQLYTIPADGNCLYCAVNHQLGVTGRNHYSIEKLREITANFMRENKDDFMPFMDNESDQPITDEQFEAYCKNIETTKFWGGQIELKALSNALKCPIKIIQASGPPTIQGEDFPGPPLIVTYHRHLYRLGEHYNSTLNLLEDDPAS